VNPSYLGVDIGTTSIKAIEVVRGFDRPKILNYGFLESNSHLTLANKVLQTSSLKIFEQEVIELLQLVLAKMKPGTDQALASIPPFAVFMTTLDLPDLSKEELSKAVVFQARQFIPLPISEVVVDWLPIGEYQDEKGFRHQQILLISVPQEQIRRYQHIFKSAGLQLLAIEIENLSIVRALMGTDQTGSVIIDIGSRSTGITFCERGQIRYTSQSDFASASLTQALATGLNINPLRAEELKRERGLTGAGPNYELSTIMLPFLDVIINEVKKAQYNYQKQFPKSAMPERAILSGGGANLLGAEKYFQDQLGIPVVKAAPFLRFEYPPSLEPVVPELNPIFSVALGLALREFKTK
jgi:type IV pilus assembly protein PilM